MRNLSEKNIRKITKMGKGQTMGITLPIEIVEKQLISKTGKNNNLR